MAPKKKRQPDAPYDPDWVAETAHRLQQSRAQSSEGFVQERSVHDDQLRAAAAAVGAPVAAETDAIPLSAVRAANLRTHASGVGLLATGFEPQRHTYMVLGRPVQAPTLVSATHLTQPCCQDACAWTSVPFALVILWNRMVPLLCVSVSVQHVMREIPDATVQRAVRECSTQRQAISLSHELASPEELEPYLGVRLAPLRPVTLYGRAAALDPPCRKEETVFYAWRDSAVGNQVPYRLGLEQVCEPWYPAPVL